MFCPYCGSQISGCDKFCTKCGKQTTDNTTMSASAANVPKSYGKKKGIVIGAISVFLCVVIIVAICFAIKSPEELLKDNEWYGEMDVDCEYHDWSSIGDGEGYWFQAECDAVIFYSDGKSRQMSYEIGNGGVYGPFSYKITSENIPSNIKWRKDIWNTYYSWEVLDKNALKYHNDYYAWDDEKDTHCNCGDSECRHSDTWYVTSKYLRIGQTTYTSQKPASLHVED